MHDTLQRLGREGVAGCGILATGLGGWLIVHGYPVGELSMIGPGFLPQVLSTLLVVLGAAIVVQAIRRAPGESRERVTIGISRPLLTIPAATAVFAVAAPVLGLAGTSALAVLVVSLATREGGATGRIVLVTILSAVTTLIFGYGLDLPVPIWPPILTELLR